MIHRGIEIIRHFIDQGDCRPPKDGEGIEWVTTNKRIHDGYTHKYSCTKYGHTAWNTVDEVKRSIDSIFDRMTRECNLSEKEVLKLLKE